MAEYEKEVRDELARHLTSPKGGANAAKIGEKSRTFFPITRWIHPTAKMPQANGPICGPSKDFEK